MIGDGGGRTSWVPAEWLRGEGIDDLVLEMGRHDSFSTGFEWL